MTKPSRRARRGLRFALAAAAALLVLAGSFLVQFRGGTGRVPTWRQLYARLGLDDGAAAPEGETAVVFLDVGQGDAVLILHNGSACLIDAGLPDTADTLIQDLQSLGVDTLELLVLTHPHADHAGGLQAVMQNFTVKRFLLPELDEGEATGATARAISEAERQDIPAVTAETGQEYAVGGGTLTVLLAGVDAETVGEDDAVNDTSLCLRFAAGGFSFLDTGDAEENEEAALLAQYGSGLRSTVFKAGHHGSSTSNTLSLLRAVSPQAAVASCGLNNDYGHPHRETVQRMEQLGIDFYRTDRDGSVTVTAEGTAISVQTAAQAKAA